MCREQQVQQSMEKEKICSIGEDIIVMAVHHIVQNQIIVPNFVAYENGILPGISLKVIFRPMSSFGAEQAVDSEIFFF